MNHLDPKENYGAEAWRQPSIEDGDTIIYNECGRVLDNICMRSYWLLIVKAQYGGYQLIVKHGGGQERFRVDHSDMIIRALQSLDSDSLYIIMFDLLKAHTNGLRTGREETEGLFKQAFVNGDLKKRKFPKQGITKVWIEKSYQPSSGIKQGDL